jgi:hypothetical protein
MKLPVYGYGRHRLYGCRFFLLAIRAVYNEAIVREYPTICKRERQSASADTLRGGTSRTISDDIGDAMAHTGRCASAKTDVRKCKCSCNGKFHGGTQGHLVSKGAASPRTSESSTSHSNSYVATPQGSLTWRSAVGVAVTEVVNWLASNPSIRDQAEAIAEIVSEQAAEMIAKYGEGPTQCEMGSSHFLCSLLASIARAIDEVKHRLDKVPDLVISFVIRQTDDGVASRAAVTFLVRSSWRLIKGLPVFGQTDALLRSARIAAILTCPAPETHKEVIRYCLWPLEGEAISAATFQLLKDALPPDWRWQGG